jgi:hypothetical protein
MDEHGDRRTEREKMATVMSQPGVGIDTSHADLTVLWNRPVRFE